MATNNKPQNRLDKYSSLIRKALPFIFFIFGVSLISSITLIDILKSVIFVLYIPLIIKHRDLFKKNVIGYLFLVYSVIFITSTILSVSPNMDYIFAYKLFINVLMFPVGVVAIQIHRRELKWLVYGLWLGSVIQFAFVFYQSLSGVKRPSGTVNTPSQFSSVAIISMLLLTTMPAYIEKIRGRKYLPYIVSFLSAGLVFASIVLSKTRGAIIAGVVGILVYIVIYIIAFKRKHGLVMLGSFILILGVLYMGVVAYFPKTADKVHSIFVYGDTYEGDCRFAIYETSMEKIEERPLIGHGPYTFELEYNSCTKAYHSHNNYLETAYSMGIPALVLLILIDIICVVLLLRVILSHDYRFYARLASLGLLASYAGYFVYGMTDLTLFNATVSPLLFLGIGLISNIKALKEGDKDSK